MSRYQHTKGQINNNAIEALLHDPLFRQRVEKNKKGKEVFYGKPNMQNEVTWRPVASKHIACLPLAFWLNQGRLFCCFSKSRISVSNTSSFVGAGGAAGSSFFLRFSLLISLMAMKMANATITKSKTF